MSEPAAGAPSRTDGPETDRAGELVDELMPADLEWRPLVLRYPLTSLAVAAVAGFALGRNRGAVILSALGTFAADSIESSVHRLLEAE